MISDRVLCFSGCNNRCVFQGSGIYSGTVFVGADSSRDDCRTNRGGTPLPRIHTPFFWLRGHGWPEKVFYDKNRVPFKDWYLGSDHCLKKETAVKEKIESPYRHHSKDFDMEVAKFIPDWKGIDERLCGMKL